MAASAPTQNFVPIEEIRDGVVTLPNGEIRAVLIASSLNLALKSADEQQAVLTQFQNFLNSLDFPIQIFVQSRRLDIRPYINLLEDRSKNVVGDLLKTQIKEYIEFIKNFTEATNIMTKNFFVVVPYSPAIISTKAGLGGVLPFGKNEKEKASNKMAEFEENRSQLEQRLSVVSEGLQRLGVRSSRLGTEEIVELFYKLFNPGDTEKPIAMK